MKKRTKKAEGEAVISTKSQGSSVQGGKVGKKQKGDSIAQKVYSRNGLLTSFFNFCQSNNVPSGSVIFLVVTSLMFIRYLISMFPHSGQAVPPMYGDYEAQRHWMEITVNLPIGEWYHNTSRNDLLYWGLDYPPLTAYLSYLFGLFGEHVEDGFMALTTSRGFESVNTKLFMRGTVLISDLLIFIPAAWYFVKTFYSHHSWPKRMAAFFLIALQPSMLIIDHGHFQYNCISLGLALWGITFVIRDEDLLGALFFCLSLNYKQMSLYFAPPFFFYLLGKNWDRTNITRSCYRIFLIGIVVIATFSIVWSPFLVSQEQALQVIRRLFPVDRGLYEDKVGNIWCALSPMFKFKSLFSTPTMLKLCMATTLAGFLPSNLHLLFHPTRKNFLLCLTTTALSFFMFSYHVHEKTILLPLLPATCLILLYPKVVTSFNVIAAFSMYPLIYKDGDTIPYIAIIHFTFLPLAYSLISQKTNKREGAMNAIPFLPLLSLAGMGILHFLLAKVTPPPRWPDLFTLSFAAFSFFHFFLLFLLWNYVQWSSTHNTSKEKTHQKQKKKE